MSSAITGATTGATMGASFGPWGALIGGGLGAVSGLLGSRGKKPTKTQQMQSELLDQLLASIKGQGPYSDLFNMDEKAFQKSYVEPAKQMFSGQIAPQIRESYISRGQAGGTNIEDALTRAGVDLDQMLNQSYMQFQQGAEQRKLTGISAILGASPGVEDRISPWEAISQGLSGAITTPEFRQEIAGIPQYFANKEKQREGFKKEP